MKLFVFIALVLAISLADNTNRLDVEGQNNIDADDADEADQKNMFEKIIRAEMGEIFENLKEQYDFLDPLVIENKRFQLKTPLELDLNISQITHGLLDFEITKFDVQLDEVSLNYAINWPSITAHGTYGLLSNYNGEKKFGNGQINAIAKNFAISVRIKLHIDDDGKLSIQIKELLFNLSLGSFDCKITGFMNDEHVSKLMSDKITNSVPQLIKVYEELINEKKTKTIGIVNDFFANIDLLNETNSSLIEKLVDYINNYFSTINFDFKY